MKLKKFIEANCSIYDKGGNCLLETSETGDCTCVYFREEKGRCMYAENCVIPGDSKVEYQYWLERGLTTASDYCEICRRPFKRKSNRQKYCEECSVEIRKRKQRKYNREYRDKLTV